MLVLTRGERQKIVIGDGVIVEVCEIKGDRVKLGITAPREVQVDRSEVRDQKQAQEKH